MTSESSEKESVPGRGRGRVLCVGAVVLREERVLFVRQAPGHALEGQWSIPWGVVENDEAAADAAVRESLEEGGVRVEVEGLLGIQELPDPGWMGVVFLCRHVDGEPKPDDHETDRALYLTLEEIDSLGEPFEPWCEWLVRRVLRGDYRLTPAQLDNPFAPRHGFL